MFRSIPPYRHLPPASGVLPEPTVFLVDLDPRLLEKLVGWLKSVGHNTRTFSSVEDFLEHHSPLLRGCLVVGVGQSGRDGPEVLRVLAAGGNQLPVVLVCEDAKIRASVFAIKAGATDFLARPVKKPHFLDAVGQAMGQDELSYDHRLEVAEICQRLATLTPREMDVLRLVITGRLNKQTAAALGTAERTVKIHRGRVMRKMGSLRWRNWCAPRIGPAFCLAFRGVKSTL